MGFSSHDNTLVTPSGVEVRFDYKIMRVVEDGEQCYVILDSPDDVVFDENVFCVGVDGVIRWQVQNEVEGTKTMCYGGAFVRNGKLTLFDVDGFSVLVDRNDGRVKDVRFDFGVGHVF